MWQTKLSLAKNIINETSMHKQIGGLKFKKKKQKNAQCGKSA